MLGGFRGTIWTLQLCLCSTPGTLRSKLTYTVLYPLPEHIDSPNFVPPISTAFLCLAIVKKDLSSTEY